MLSLGDWIRGHERSIMKVYVTTKLPSHRSNVAGLVKMLERSGVSYTYFKLWINVLARRWLRRQGLPGSVEDYLSLCGLKIPLQSTDSVNRPEVVKEVAELAPAFLVSFSATELFRSPLLEAASRGAINMHWGALPAYAGLSPYFWHLHHKERKFGVTLHQIDLAVDAGPVIDQVFQDMSDARTALEVALRMTDCVSEMLCRFFTGPASLANLRYQDLSERTYFGHPTRAQLREFHSKGFSMIDRKSREMLRDRIRALAQRSARKLHSHAVR